eukprot:scaffold569_cov408-Prasinococcus_capsulatus_cf.AAC.11
MSSSAVRPRALLDVVARGQPRRPQVSLRWLERPRRLRHPWPARLAGSTAVARQLASSSRGASRARTPRTRHAYISHGLGLEPSQHGSRRTGGRTRAGTGEACRRRTAAAYRHRGLPARMASFTLNTAINYYCFAIASAAASFCPRRLWVARPSDALSQGAGMVTHAVKLGTANDPFLQHAAAFRLKALAFTDQTRESLAQEGGIDALMVCAPGRRHSRCCGPTRVASSLCHALLHVKDLLRRTSEQGGRAVEGRAHVQEEVILALEAFSRSGTRVVIVEYAVVPRRPRVGVLPVSRCRGCAAENVRCQRA